MPALPDDVSRTQVEKAGIGLGLRFLSVG